MFVCLAVPALCDCYFFVAGQLGGSVTVLLGGTAHSHQAVQLSNKIQNLHIVYIQ